VYRPQPHLRILRATWLTVALLAVVAVAAALTVACKKQAAPGPDVWAVVNGKEIAREEVEKQFRARIDPDRDEPSPEEAWTLKLSVLEELINNELPTAKWKTASRK
jgi:hypothetical protein